jgi:hypothetical protein
LLTHTLFSASSYSLLHKGTYFGCHLWTKYIQKYISFSLIVLHFVNEIYTEVYLIFTNRNKNGIWHIESKKRNDITMLSSSIFSFYRSSWFILGFSNVNHILYVCWRSWLLEIVFFFNKWNVQYLWSLIAVSNNVIGIELSPLQAHSSHSDDHYSTSYVPPTLTQIPCKAVRRSCTSLLSTIFRYKVGLYSLKKGRGKLLIPR